MTDENDRKDENQPQKRVGWVREGWLWALALFVSIILRIVWTLIVDTGDAGPLWAIAMIIFIGIPASVIGFILGLGFGAPRLANSAMGFILGRGILVMLCLGLMRYLEEINVVLLWFMR